MPLGRSASAATAAHDRVAAAEASCHVGALRDYGDCLKPGTPDPDFFFSPIPMVFLGDD